MRVRVEEYDSSAFATFLSPTALSIQPSRRTNNWEHHFPKTMTIEITLMEGVHWSFPHNNRRGSSNGYLSLVDSASCLRRVLVEQWSSKRRGVFLPCWCWCLVEFYCCCYATETPLRHLERMIARYLFFLWLSWGLISGTLFL